MAIEEKNYNATSMPVSFVLCAPPSPAPRVLRAEHAIVSNVHAVKRILRGLQSSDAVADIFAEETSSDNRRDRERGEQVRVYETV